MTIEAYIQKNYSVEKVAKGFTAIEVCKMVKEYQKIICKQTKNKKSVVKFCTGLGLRFEI